jgi:hypothetical protein
MARDHPNPFSCCCRYAAIAAGVVDDDADAAAAAGGDDANSDGGSGVDVGCLCGTPAIAAVQPLLSLLLLLPLLLWW